MERNCVKEEQAGDDKARLQKTIQLKAVYLNMPLSDNLFLPYCSWLHSTEIKSLAELDSLCDYFFSSFSSFLFARAAILLVIRSLFAVKHRSSSSH